MKALLQVKQSLKLSGQPETLNLCFHLKRKLRKTMILQLMVHQGKKNQTLKFVGKKNQTLKFVGSNTKILHVNGYLTST